MGAKIRPKIENIGKKGITDQLQRVFARVKLDEGVTLKLWSAFKKIDINGNGTT